MDASLTRKRSTSTLRLMEMIVDRAPVTRKGLADLSRYSFPTVLKSVHRLIEAGLVVEVPTRDAVKPGPRASELRLKRDDKFILAVEVRSNLLIGIVMNFAGRVIARERRLCRAQERPKTVARILEMVAALSRRVPGRDPARSVVIAFPGHIGSGHRSVSMFHGRPGWEGYPLAETIERRFGVETFLINNGQAYILAEAHFGPAAGTRNMLGLYLDNAMSLGILVDGRAYRGETFAAGEIGHFSSGKGMEVCHCGRRGCLELSCSEIHLLEKMNARLGTNLPTVRDILARIDPSSEDGRFAYGLIDDGLLVLSRAVAAVVTLLNPGLLVVHGGIAALVPDAVERIRDFVLRHAFPPSAGVRIELSTLDETACALGAGAFFIQRFYDTGRDYIPRLLAPAGLRP